MKKDKFTRKAKREGYRARSVFKLFSMNKKYDLIKERDKVLDLGCWPGSWMQALKEMGANVVGIDVIKIDEIEGVNFIKGDITSSKIQEKIKRYSPFDVVISDLAPSTTGIKDIDSSKSLELSKTSFDVAKENLRIGGNFICKIFQSDGASELKKDAKKYFSFVKFNKPLASKKSSREIYLVCKNFEKS